MILALLTATLLAPAAPQDLPLKRKKTEVKVLSATPDKKEVRVGETFTLDVALEIPAGWYIYPTVPTTTGTPTHFVFDGAEAAGPIQEPKPKTKPKSDDVDAYDYHEGKITLRAPLRLKPGAKPGPLTLKGVVDYQICSTVCIPNTSPVEVAVTVLEGAVQVPPPPPPPPPTGAAAPPASFLLMLGFAFLGGLILNVMPCVLPVLMSKMGSLVKQKDLTAGAKRAAGLAYTGGVVLCLLGFGAAVATLRGLGKSVGWGFQFQEPLFVISLATLIFVFALSLLGVFMVPALATGVSAQTAKSQGLAKHFFSGLFVTLVATPCSAPLLGSAMGYAFTLPALGILLFFGAVGLGLASPFLLVGFFPALLRFMPRPGAWMEVFERVTGFILLAVVVWLCDTIGALTGHEGLLGFLAFLTAVALGAWVVGRWGNEVQPLGARLASLAAALVLAGGAGAWFVKTDIVQPAEAVGFRMENLDFAKKVPWQPFSDENVAAVRAARKPGFIDFTADW
jgi:thiol:disulfide interchange protein DsbD